MCPVPMCLVSVYRCFYSANGFIADVCITDVPISEISCAYIVIVFCANLIDAHASIADVSNVDVQLLIFSADFSGAGGLNADIPGANVLDADASGADFLFPMMCMCI